jgi:succinoglycan biosynthesis protein ExoO
MDPKVSVIIPAYNTEGYIAKTVKSALGQTERDIEVIVVDDASTDDTANVVKGFSDKRLKLTVNERNRGPSYTRNRAMKKAKGEWVALLDSDDWYAPERLQRLLQVARVENADLVADDLYLVRDGSKHPWSTLFSVAGEQFNGPRHIDAADFVETNMPGRRCLRLGITKPLIKRTFLTRHNLGYNENVRHGEDFLFYLACLLNGARFVVVPEPYYFYSRRPSSLLTEGKLDVLDSLRRENRQLLQKESVKNDPRLVHTLSRRLSTIEQNMVYYRVVQPLKEGKLPKALSEMVRNPRFYALFIAQVPRIAYYRLRRRFGKVASG